MFWFHFFAMLLGAFVGEFLAEWFFERYLIKEEFEPYEERVGYLKVLLDEQDEYCRELEKDILRLSAELYELKDKVSINEF